MAKCELCKYHFLDGVFLEMVPCGHKCHARCIHQWTILVCPICCESCIVKHINLQSNHHELGSTTRKGRWSHAEIQFATLLSRFYCNQQIPISSKTDYFYMLTCLLNCKKSRIYHKIHQIQEKDNTLSRFSKENLKLYRLDCSKDTQLNQNDHPSPTTPKETPLLQKDEPKTHRLRSSKMQATPTLPTSKIQPSQKTQPIKKINGICFKSHLRNMRRLAISEEGFLSQLKFDCGIQVYRRVLKSWNLFWDYNTLAYMKERQQPIGFQENIQDIKNSPQNQEKRMRVRFILNP